MVAYYFVYDGWDLIEERNASGTLLASYVHGARQDELLTRTNSSGTTSYYYHNALGSVAGLTNASGVVVEQYKYDIYGTASITDGSGNPLTATAYGNRFLFTGREFLADVGLYDYRNRVYSAVLGRFLQTDPIRNQIFDFISRDPLSGAEFSQGTNLYAYVINDCVNLIDTFGLDYTYHVSTGQMVHTDSAGNSTVVGTGYSGDGTNKNSTSGENVSGDLPNGGHNPNSGAIPQGDYTIGAPQNTHVGQPSFTLTPNSGTNTFGRAGFMIHADSTSHPGHASSGCIVQSQGTRQGIAGNVNNGDNQLHVVP